MQPNGCQSRRLPLLLALALAQLLALVVVVCRAEQAEISSIYSSSAGHVVIGPANSTHGTVEMPSIRIKGHAASSRPPLDLTVDEAGNLHINSTHSIGLFLNGQQVALHQEPAPTQVSQRLVVKDHWGHVQPGGGPASEQTKYTPQGNTWFTFGIEPRSVVVPGTAPVCLEMDLTFYGDVGRQGGGSNDFEVRFRFLVTFPNATVPSEQFNAPFSAGSHHERELRMATTQCIPPGPVQVRLQGFLNFGIGTPFTVDYTWREAALGQGFRHLELKSVACSCS